MKQQKTPALPTAIGIFEMNQEVLAFFSQNCRKYL